MYIKRKLEATILRYLDSPEIIAVVGARQAGKTSMISRLMKKLDRAVSVSFDDREILTLFEKTPNDFIAAYVKGNKYLFIDEFQYAKEGGKILKYIFDKHKIKIILSGSSAVDLTIRATKYLVGRIIVFNLYPFDFEEFLRAKDESNLKIYLKYQKKAALTRKTSLKMPEIIHRKLGQLYEEYLRFGGYPRVVLENSLEAKKELLKNIYNTYFLREVKDTLGLIDDYKLSNLIKGLALQIGNLVEYAELSRLSGYSFLALKKYLNFLEKTYVCRFIRPFFKNKRTEIVKNPKVYFIDSGLRNCVIDDFRKQGVRIDSGGLLENGLAEQFIKKDLSFNFWRDKKKNELDFVVSLGEGRIVAIESKNYLKSKEINSAKVFKKNYPEIEVYFSYRDINSKLRETAGCYPVYLF